MKANHIRILMAEDDPDFAAMVALHLKKQTKFTYQLLREETLESTVLRAEKGEADIVFLDLGLPDSNGVETVRRFRQKVAEIPLIVLTGNDDDECGAEALRNGAQDYLPKKEVNASLMARSVRYSFERFEMEKKLKDLSLSDSLTGLSNRRGFLTLAEQQLKALKRSGEGAMLLYCDLDGLKKINDDCGHAAGDEAICHASTLLRQSFRPADIVARIGGDEFAILAMETEGRTLVDRIERCFAEFNRNKKFQKELGISIGWIEIGAEGTSAGLEGLMQEADARLYENKKAKKRA